MLIRERRDDDLPACLDVLLRVHERDGYPLHLPAARTAEFFSSPHEVGAWVAELSGRVAGHVGLHVRPEDYTVAVARDATGLPEERLAMVARLFVAPEARRIGVGRALLRQATAQARAIGRRAVLDVGQTLHKAVALYEAEGWTRVGELHLREDGHPDLDLWVYLSPESDPVELADLLPDRRIQ